MHITLSERNELQVMLRAHHISAVQAQRARLILALADGLTHAEIMEQLGVSPTYIARWKGRFVDDRLAGLVSQYAGAGNRERVLTPKLEARILDATRRKPKDGSTHWSTRKLARELGVSHMMVARTWAKHRLKPHRVERYMLSNDPNFESKAADVIGLYLNPPTHAAVFCVDEKTAIQALDRLDPVLPLSPGRAERHGFEYYRHGTLSLYAALNTKTGKILGRTTARHTSADFVAFLTAIVASQPRGKEIHVIVDNLSAHKTKLVGEFLAAHPNVRLHFTPTYSSWLNQVELWFSKIERDVISRGIFSSVKDLARKIVRYIDHYNERAKPVSWKYADASRRIA